jgi:cyclic pyranopterin phosphate synthase
MSAPTPLLDRRNRPLRDLRISVMDRCNFRCTYCMPASTYGEDYAFLPPEARLSFDEIERVCRQAAALGVSKLRLTGGEPLLRPQLPDLIRRLRRIDGIDDIALTTNGVLLDRQSNALADAGLDRVTVSLDTLDPALFRQISGGRGDVDAVLRGIDAAKDAGFRDGVKINAVLQRGRNDAGALDLVERFRGSSVVLRFIEFMDVGSTNGWRMDDVVPSASVVQRISERWPLEPIDPNYAGEVAERWRYLDGAGEIGVISSVTQAFCSSCTRMRLSTEGSLFTCLFAQSGHDLKSLLRAGASDDQLRNEIAALWQRRTDRYSEIRTAETSRERKVEMSYIGG